MKLACDNKTALSLLDVAGSCVVDIFYNHMYDRSISLHEKTSRGLSECYRQVISEYIAESNDPRFYSVLLNSLHHYVRMSTIYHGIAYTECVKLYTALFVPQMYMPSLTVEQSINILSMILGNVIRIFGDEINQQHIAGIIDSHDDPLNVEILQDSVLKILLREREESYDRFIESQKPDSTRSSSVKKQLANQNQYRQSLQRLTTAFKKSVHERAELKKRNVALVKKNQVLSSQFQDLKQMMLTQIASHKEQASIVEELRSRLMNTTQHSSDRPESIKEDSKARSRSSSDSSENDMFSVQYIEDNDDSEF